MRSVSRLFRFAVISATLVGASTASAIEKSGSAPLECFQSCCRTRHDMNSQTGHAAMPDGMMSHEHASTLLDAIEMHAASGTDVEPISTPHSMWMADRSGWKLKFHGNFFVNELQQTGPRGGDKFFSTNWLMPMAQHDLGPGKFTARVMFSLEPATITGRRYPELFQIGETAFGLPIVDGQHPHNLFM